MDHILHISNASRADNWDEILYTNTFVKDNKIINIDKKYLDSCVDYFSYLRERGNIIPLVKNHSKDPADKIGRVTDLQVRQKSDSSYGLYMKREADDDDMEKVIKSSSYSIWGKTGHKEADGREFVAALLHVGVTDYPIVKGLEKDIQFEIFSEQEPIIEIKEIKSMKKVFETLGLTEDATEDQVLSILTKLKSDNEAALAEVTKSRLSRIDSLAISDVQKEKLKGEVDNPSFELMLSFIPVEVPVEGFSTGNQNSESDDNLLSEDVDSEMIKFMQERHK